MYMKDWHLAVSGNPAKRTMAIPKKDGERFIFKTVYHPSNRAKFKVGNIYTIQNPEDKLGIFKIKITSIRHSAARYVTDEIAKRLGYKSPKHWLKKWNAYFANGNPIDANTELFLIDFLLV